MGFAHGQTDIGTSSPHGPAELEISNRQGRTHSAQFKRLIG